MNLPDSATLQAASIPGSIPLAARIVLWASVGVCLLMALGIGVALIAGNNSKPAHTARLFALGLGVAILVQGGYLAAPFAIGRTWWAWAFWWMLPVVLLTLLALSVPVLGAIKWTRPDGASGWKTIASIGWLGAVGTALYILPPVLLWVYRPPPTP
jgi:hypothetical protein